MAASVKACPQEIALQLALDAKKIDDAAIVLANGSKIQFRTPDDAQQALKHVERLRGLATFEGSLQ